MNTYAGFWKRTGAFALDYLVILQYLVAITIIFLFIPSLSNATSWLFAERVRAQLSGFLLITLPIMLYFTLSEASIQRATWGKKKMSLQVTDDYGRRISF